MPCVCYVKRRFGRAATAVIEQANEIISEYADQGFNLTLRQLYYQFVARDLMANTVRDYKRLGEIINDARLAGLIDWDRLIDRTRGLERLATWSSPEDLVS